MHRYCGIATVLSIIQAATTNRGAVDYSRPPLDTTTFAFGVMNSLVTMLFAYGGHNIALEVRGCWVQSGGHVTTLDVQMHVCVQPIHEELCCCVFTLKHTHHV